MAKTQSVDEFLDKLSHRRISEIRSLRSILLNVGPEVSERVKWNAPSFCWDADDRITMRLQPGDRLELIFHRGAKPKQAAHFNFVDTTGRIKWVADDRGVLEVEDPETESDMLGALAKAWFVATK